MTEIRVNGNIAVLELQAPGKWAGHLRSTVTGRANSGRYYASTRRAMLALLRRVALTAPPASEHVRLARLPRLA